MQRAARSCHLPLYLVQFANPDVPEAPGIAVILQAEREFLRVRFVGRTLAVLCWAGELDVVLYEDAVVKNRGAGRAKQFAAGIETRAAEDDVIPLPLAWRTCGVRERWILAVQR